MIEHFTYVFQYLEKEQINIDKKEFKFQIQSHPDYPSLVSITDTLSFFNIENGVIVVDSSEIELLPDIFVALLDMKINQPQFYLVEKIGDVYFYTEEKKKILISKRELKASWKNTVLLAEKSILDGIPPASKNVFFWLLPSLWIGLFFLILLLSPINIETKIFIILPIFGVLFSVAALKDLFSIKSELLNSFCNITAFTSCTTVVASSKWKIFEIVNFSDLSLVFFSSQFFGLLLFLFMGDEMAYFSIQKIILVCCVPVLLISVYYQKVVEKKWCPICLVIIGIILLEFGYIVLLIRSSFDFQLYSVTNFGLAFLTVTLGWFALKNLLSEQKELKEFQIKANRFMRNYDIFKNNLLASDSIKHNRMQSEETIILGNPDAFLKIIVVTSPFCGFCEEVHTIIEKILEKHSETVCFDIRFNFNYANSDEKSKKVHQKLVAIYYEQGQKAFMKALHDWFENKDENKLNILGNAVINELKLNLILEEQFNWNQLNRINYTPAIIINSYFLPKHYDKSDLLHFINDLSEDEDFQFIL